MRIVYAGDFSQSWHTESHVARDMETLGHEVVRHQSEFRGPLLNACADADLLLLQANGGLPSEFAASWLRDVEALGCATASYHLDLFVGLPRADRIDHDVMFRAGTVFTADGDPHSAEVFASHGVNHRWLPPAVVSDECVPGRYRAQYEYDVVFVGAENYHEAWPQRRALIERMRAEYGNRFGLFGHHPPTRDLNLNDLFATARVVVGDSLSLPGHSLYTSDRLFETLGRGGVLVYPRIPGIEDAFGLRDHEHLRYYEIGDFDGCVAIIDELLDDAVGARAMAARGQAFVAGRHTYRDRVQQMLTMLNLSVAA